MNYDAKQYTFGHGLPTAPQIHLQQQFQQQQFQHQQFQQQHQQIFQQYNQVVPTSNVYQFQFAGGGNHMGQIFQPKDGHQIGMSGNMQPRLPPHGMVSQPFIKQGVPVGIDGGSLHLVSGLDGVLYSQQKSNVGIITSADGRMVQQQQQQPDEAARMQQALVRVDMMRNSSFADQSLGAQQIQHPGTRMPGHGNAFAYSKHHFPGWLQPQQISNPNTGQPRPADCQSTLPSFGHVWSQIQQHHKPMDVIHQQHVHQYQQQQYQPSQQYQLPQQQQQFPASASFQALPAAPVMRVQQQQQKPQQMSVALSAHNVPHLPQQLNCFSPSQANLISPKTMDTDIDKGIPFRETCVPISSLAPVHSLPCSQQPLSCIEHHPTTAVTYTVSGPPKVTITLDSLTHPETFPPVNQLPGRPEVSFSSHGGSPAQFIKSRLIKAAPSCIASSLLTENFHSQPQRDWQQMSQAQRTPCLSKSLVHTSSTGSSLERSSSESSSFSSPPYIFTPPSSTDSMFSPVLSQFPKTLIENSSGRTSELSSTSSSSSSSATPLSSSPPVPLCIPSQPAVPTVTAASSIASPTYTTSAAAVAFSCNSVAVTTTSVMSISPSPKENSGIDSVHLNMPVKNTSSCKPEGLNLPCRLSSSSSSLSLDDGADKKVKVPYSWQRRFENGVIVYLSPSGEVLQSLDQICHYLLSDNTCKCGLECPIQLEKSFSFDPEIGSQPWSLGCGGSESLENLCNHRREVLALSAFHTSQAEAAIQSTDNNMQMGKKRERRKSVGPGEGLIVAPLKRLKTSITDAVNKHAAQSMGNSTTSHTTLAGAGARLYKASRKTPLSPASSQGGLSKSGACSDLANPGDCLGRLEFEKVHAGLEDDKTALALSVNMQNLSDCDGRRRIQHRHQQYLQTGHHDGNRSQAYMPVEDGHLFHQGNGRELFHHPQYPEEFSSEQQSAVPPGMFYPPQSQFYPNMPHMLQQQQQHNQLFRSSTSWQSGSAPIPHHPPPRQCQMNAAGFQPSAFNHTQQACSHTQQAHRNKTSVDSTKIKSKRPKSKRDKQKQLNSIVDRSSPCQKSSSSSSKPTKTAPIPSTTASFFGNPIVFVEQQTAMINSSLQIASSSSPPPPQCRPPQSPVCPSSSSTTFENVVRDTQRSNKPGMNQSFKNLNNNKINLDKEDDEDQKTGTDLDSNKSFSDTTENNDSAYLSQTGSDQEKLDAIDGLDSSIETKATPLDIHNFNSAGERKQKAHAADGNKKLSENSSASTYSMMAKNSSVSKVKLHQEPATTTAATGGRVNSNTSKSQEHKKVPASRLRQKAGTTAKKDGCIQEMELLKRSVASGLNGDLLQPLASNNWNMSTLQQALAQYSKGDHNQLNAILQQAQLQAGTGVSFPASSLLTAAANAQLHLKKEQFPASLPNGINPVSLPQNTKPEVMTPPMAVTGGGGDVKTGAPLSAGVCGTLVSSVCGQPQPSFQQIGAGAATNLISNMMQFQQLPSAGFTMNMLLPGQGSLYDPLHSGTFGADADLKNGQTAVNPLVAQGILATVAQTGDMGSQIKLSVASVIPSNLGPSVAPCAADSSAVLLNSFGPRMIMNAPMPPVSVSVVTNVTKSLTQVIPTIGINQTMFGPQQILSSQQNGPQIINAGTAPSGPHMISGPAQGPQLVSTAPQAAQFVNATAQNAQFMSNTSQATQIMNALSVQGFSNQLLIASPIQQVSPSASLSQLSPAMAAQILAAQSHQQLPQMSPSYLHNQIQKQAQNSLINSQNIFASVSVPALTVSSDSGDVISQAAGIINSNIPKAQQRSMDGLDKLDIANSGSQLKDGSSSIANSPMYAATSQPVFVIPQANSNPVMQMLGSAQALNAAGPGISADLNIQQGSMTQLFGQPTPTIDPSLIQNLVTGGFSPLALQQMLPTVNLSGVQQQQQQQLQMLQLQQLMLQQLQNQSQNIQGISVPLNPSSTPSQVATIGPQTIMGAVVPQPGLQLNPVVDMSSLHPCLSPVAQGYQNQLPQQAAAQLQHMSSTLAVHQVTPINSCSTMSIIQSGGMQNLMQIPAKRLQAGGHSVPSQPLPPDQVIHTNQNPAVLPPSATACHEADKVSTPQAQQPAANTAKPAAAPAAAAAASTNNHPTKPAQPSKPKSKSKSKKSESKKITDSETEKSEEVIAATVQQILAQAVQQQKELSLAAKNQPPLPPKNKSKKSQHRAKTGQTLKEHELGKLASISDDAVIPKSDSIMNDKMLYETPQKCSLVVESKHFPLVVTDSIQSEAQQTPSSCSAFPAILTCVPNGLNGIDTSSPLIGNFVEQALNEASIVNINKRSSISLKDHLSSIISKDKDLVAGTNQKPGKCKLSGEAKVNHAVQPPVAVGYGTSIPAQTQRRSIK